MNNTVKIALGGMSVALSVAIMLMSSVISVLIYSIPAIAALVVMFIRIECNWKWGLAVFACTSVLSALLVPQKEAVAIYIALLGYYPIIKLLFDKLKRIPGMIVKSLFFVIVIVSTYYVIMRFFGLSTDLIDVTNKFFIPVLVFLGLIAFILFDIALDRLEIVYYRNWQKRIKKLLKRR